ncbi:ANTAR domain-containing protein [Streptomyces sp. NPDC058305]|uniref:ANTAR domain-containing protein n=1 Tax=Streptomyces sp. NPDC058305 TaxID=3346438 RepID=UPI0036F0AA31
MSVHANGTKPAPPASFEQAARHVAELKDENAHLQQAVHAHAVIDQAIGVLLAAGGLTPDQGWNALREVSQRTNTKLRHVRFDVSRLFKLVFEKTVRQAASMGVPWSMSSPLAASVPPVPGLWNLRFCCGLHRWNLRR